MAVCGCYGVYVMLFTVQFTLPGSYGTYLCGDVTVALLPTNLLSYLPGEINPNLILLFTINIHIPMFTHHNLTHHNSFEEYKPTDHRQMCQCEHGWLFWQQTADVDWSLVMLWMKVPWWIRHITCLASHSVSMQLDSFTSDICTINSLIGS